MLHDLVSTLTQEQSSHKTAKIATARSHASVPKEIEVKRQHSSDKDTEMIRVY